MKREYITGVAFFIMKYFFDIEKEIIQQMWTSVSVKVNGYRENIMHMHLLPIHKQ